MVLLTKFISIKTKLRLYKSNVLSVLLYGTETWFLNTAVVSKLQTYVNKCLRRIHKIFWLNKISNIELLERSDMSDIKLTIKQRKWRWLGHTFRKGRDNITNQSLKWNPQGNCKVGRPKSTVKRKLQNELKRDQQNSQWSLNSCCFQRKMEKLAWPMLYLEINGNDDDVCCQTCTKEIAYDLILSRWQTDIKKYFEAAWLYQKT